MPALRQLAASMDEDDKVEWYASSGDDDEAVGDYRIGALTERGWQSGEMSVVSFTLPRDHAYVAEALAERMGGLEALYNILRTHGIEPKRMAAGFFIMAGQEPDIAPIGNGAPFRLIEINALLRPLMNGAFGSMGFGPRGGRMETDCEAMTVFFEQSMVRGSKINGVSGVSCDLGQYRTDVSRM